MLFYKPPQVGIQQVAEALLKVREDPKYGLKFREGIYDVYGDLCENMYYGWDFDQWGDFAGDKPWDWTD